MSMFPSFEEDLYTYVNYYSWYNKDSGERSQPIMTKIISEPWQLGHGQIVVKVEGISGGVSIEHLEEIV